MSDTNRKMIQPLIEYKIDRQAIAFVNEVFFTKPDGPYFEAMLAVRAYHSTVDAGDIIGTALTRCESEIEKMMMCALYTAGYGYSSVRFLLSEWDQRALDRGEEGICLWIQPQFVVDKYRADFRIIYDDYKPDFENPVTRDGITLPGPPVLERKQVLIECDGHDYHERTKDQAKRDRSKDRRLQSLGHKIFRFTGSEIFKDPMKCASEVLMELEASHYEVNN